MALITVRGNDALDINPSFADNSLTDKGSDWLWAVMAVYGITFLAWLFWTLSLRRQRHTTTTAAPRTATDGTGAAPPKSSNNAAGLDPGFRGERIFHYLFTIAAFTGLISYFTLASNLGNTPVRQYKYTDLDSDSTSLYTREVFYTRYIYWFVAWPLVLLANLILSGLSWATSLFAIALLETWVVTWLSGALTSSSYRWGYYTFGLFAYLVLAYILLAWGRMSSRDIGSTKSYTLLAGILVVVWAIYPIAWGVSEGSNRISVSGENYFYGILDLISVPIYGSFFLLQSRKFDHASLFSFTQRGRVRHGAPVTAYNGEPATVQGGV